MWVIMDYYESIQLLFCLAVITFVNYLSISQTLENAFDSTTDGNIVCTIFILLFMVLWVRLLAELLSSLSVF